MVHGPIKKAKKLKNPNSEKNFLALSSYFENSGSTVNQDLFDYAAADKGNSSKLFRFDENCSVKLFKIRELIH